MGNKTFGIVIAVIVGAVIALIAFGGTSEAPSSSLSREEILAVTETDYIKNSDTSVDELNKKVEIIEYGDFQCPACGAVYPIVQEALLGYEDDVAFVFRHFPLVSIHPNAMIAHRAAEAAGEQGKFFDMHDLLYERQQLWSTGDSADDIISVFAEELELNIDQYRETFNSSETLQKINTQLDAGQSIGVSATPTFFVNGEQLEQSPRSVEELRAIIEQALSN